MNRMTLAEKLIRLADMIVGFAEPLEIRVSQTERLFADTDFDAADFEDEVSAIIRRYGYPIKVKAGRKYAGQWTWTWDLPEEANRDLVSIKQEIKRLPEWKVVGKYGAIIEIGQN